MGGRSGRLRPRIERRFYPGRRAHARAEKKVDRAQSPYGRGLAI